MARYLLVAPDLLMFEAKRAAALEGVSFAAFLRGLMRDRLGSRGSEVAESSRPVFVPVAPVAVSEVEKCRHGFLVRQCKFGCYTPAVPLHDSGGSVT